MAPHYEQIKGKKVDALKRTGVVHDSRYTDHCTGPGHPECSQRQSVLNDMLAEPDVRELFLPIVPRPAEKEELLQVHSPKYLRRIEQTKGKAYTYLDADTEASPFSYDTALLAAGGICRAIELVHTGELDNAFALVRPPGHHAVRSRAQGFCIFNNVAVGVRYAQKRLGLDRILVVDWDLHHGNGTQNCFEDDPSVLFFSIHQSASYPGTGRFTEIGKGLGKGRTVNIPLRAGCGDGEYIALFEKLLRPMALEFAPQLVLVSAGFDTHHKDPFSGMRVTPQGFAGMARSVLNTADLCCGGKVVMTLEGGYDLQALKESVKAVIMELAGFQITNVAELAAGGDGKMLAYLIGRVRRVHAKYWQCLRDLAVNDSNPDPNVFARMKEAAIRIRDYLKN